MALDKWQEREAATYAAQNDMTPEAAARELFPDAVPPAPRRTVAAKAPAKEPAKEKETAPTS
ncbi:MAG: hypothetical protein HOV73_01760 [Streptomyces sp.]|nr:hypothetical protein [Streptomyces sp.]